ncbi:MAG: oligosaccharide flippase family protein [Candidatus Altiarchaeota archaeon]
MMEPKNNVTISSVLRQSLKFNAVNIFCKIISIPKSIIVAMILVPEEYGIIGLLGLWLTYAGLINPGLESAASREVPYLLGKGEKEKALHIQNVSITSKFLYTFLPFLVILGTSFFYSNKIIQIGLILTAVTYMISSNADNWSLFNHARQNFNKVATGYLIKGITVPVVTIALIFWLKIYAVLLAPILGAILAFIYYLQKGGINYHFEINWNETVKLMKIGIPMALLTIAYWGYRMADSTMIAAFLPLHEMGLYSYALGMVSYAILFFSEFGGVLQPILWTGLGQSRNHIEGFKPLQKIAVYLSIATALTIGISQIGFYLLVHLVTTNFIESIPVFNILTFSIFFMAIICVPGVILPSSVVNKQTLNTKIWIAGLILNVILDYLVIKMGYGILGVSVATITVQGLIALTLFYAVRRYMFYNTQEFIGFIQRILLPPSISFIIYLVNMSYTSKIQNVFFHSGVSLILYIIVWMIVIRLFYLTYFPKEKIVNIWREATRLGRPISSN